MTERVWVTPSGACYHKSRDCRRVHHWLRIGMVLIDREQAQRLGRGPCTGRFCWPERSRALLWGEPA